MDFMLTAFITSAKGRGYVIAVVFVCVFFRKITQKENEKGPRKSSLYFGDVPDSTIIKSKIIKQPIVLCYFVLQLPYMLHYRCKPQMWVLGGGSTLWAFLV